MKKLVLLLIFLVGIALNNHLISQETKSIAEQRKDNIIKLLDYRFKGGYYTFEKIFLQTVEYPPAAAGNCIMGIAIATFRVNCEGEIYDLIVKTRMGYGIENEISTFLTKTEGNWNKCHDDKYTKFEVPIQFKLEGTETNTEDALLVLVTENPGFVCNDDEYYIKKIDKYVSKGKYKRALQYIEVMRRRDPYNAYYNDLRMKAMGIE